jgi:hypothetical protein
MRQETHIEQYEAIRSSMMNDWDTKGREETIKTIATLRADADKDDDNDGSKKGDDNDENEWEQPDLSQLKFPQGNHQKEGTPLLDPGPTSTNV